MASPCTFLLSILVGSGGHNYTVEAATEANVVDVGARICRLRVYSPGNGEPCILHSPGIPVTNDTTNNALDDIGSVFIGNICPVNRLQGDGFTTKFKISAIFEIATLGSTRKKESSWSIVLHTYTKFRL